MAPNLADMPLGPLPSLPQPDRDGIRTREPIPAGRFILGNRVLVPMKGPKGIGIYIQSQESADAIDFHPCEGRGGGGRGGGGGGAAATSKGRQRLQSSGQDPSTYIPYDPPQAQQARGGTDPVDPAWKDLLMELSVLDTSTLGERERYELSIGRVFPMLKYIRDVPGEAGREWHGRMMVVVEKLGMSGKFGDLDLGRPKGLFDDFGL
ncbi:hypothetical protein B0A55_07305 [Friedmanniomyces simplex]|uniref:Uncharacterized protein n=1 Tax=Friedmanniomyces simplex TaxID=329884 RepID=A0A4U0X8A5_9PEZI|nr:hypothetical protein B0A55_07305 [Friedmanniomyces simplex]